MDTRRSFRNWSKSPKNMFNLVVLRNPYNKKDLFSIIERKRLVEESKDLMHLLSHFQTECPHMVVRPSLVF